PAGRVRELCRGGGGQGGGGEREHDVVDRLFHAAAIRRGERLSAIGGHEVRPGERGRSDERERRGERGGEPGGPHDRLPQYRAISSADSSAGARDTRSA